MPMRKELSIVEQHSSPSERCWQPAKSAIVLPTHKRKLIFERKKAEPAEFSYLPFQVSYGLGDLLSDYAGLQKTTMIDMNIKTVVVLICCEKKMLHPGELKIMSKNNCQCGIPGG
jgi:hypothetical protein